MPRKLTRKLIEQALANPAKVVLNYGETLELSRIALAALDGDPTAWKLEGGGAPDHITLDARAAHADPLRDVTPLYEHAKPVLVVPKEWTIADAVKFCKETGRKDAGAALEAWNACRITMLSSAGAAENRRSNENTQVVQMQSGTIRASEPAQSGSEFAVAPVNDVTAGKPLTITLPDISSKAFWSGTGKAEVFHPETYKRWVKEAIEGHCAIARIDVEVK